MNRTLLKKCIRDTRLLWAACALLLLSFCWLRMYIVSRVEMDAFTRIVGELWDKWSAFSPVSLQQLLSYSGRVALSYDEPIVVFAVAFFAIARGSDCVSGELGRGTLEMLLAQPLSRLQVIFAQSSITIYGIALLALCVWGGIVGGVHSFTVKEEVRHDFFIPVLNMHVTNPLAKTEIVKVPMREKVNVNDFLPATVNLFSLGVCLAGVTTFCSACDRYRWRTIGIASGLLVLQMIIKFGAMAIPEFPWLHYGTIFTVYNPQLIVQHAVQSPATVWNVILRTPTGEFQTLGPLGMDLVLLGIGLGSYLLAAIVFHRRDLPAPL